MKIKSFSFSGLFNNKTFLMIISIIGAIFIWATITLTVKTDSEKTMRNIPIDFSVQGTSVEALGLNVFEHSADTINLKLSGSRNSINLISKEDITVNMLLGKVVGPGKYTIQLNISLKEGVGDAKVVDYTPKSIQVSFDRLATKTLTVDTDISDFSALDGYMLDKGYPATPEVNISGPESIIKTINTCVANTSNVKIKDKLLNKTITVPVPLMLYNENGAEVADENITLDKETVDVSIPVLKIKTLPIVAHFINQPSNFAEKEFSYSLSTKKISIAGPEETIDAMSQVDIRYVDLKTVKAGDVVSLNVELPSGFINVDNITSVDVTIPSKKMNEKTFNITNFKVVGTPDDKNVNVITKRLNNVKIIGEESIISSLAASDIVAEVNLTGATLSSGTSNYSATITIPGKSGVFWAYGDYEVVIRTY